MAKWMKPSDGLPECDCGDRVVGVVRYSVPYNDGSGTLPAYSSIQPHVIVLIATENGFHDVEDGGFNIYDCELWMLESDLLKIADVDPSA